MDGATDTQSTLTDPPAKRFSFLQNLYNRCMDWIATPAGVWVLFFISLAESSFFPIPPDVFLIALCVAIPKKSFKYAAICTLASVLGGMIGYGLGYGFMGIVGQPILDWYGLAGKYAEVQTLYQTYDGWAVFVAGLTPIPYKLFTIAAGAFNINFPTFVIASILSRGLRFFLICALIYKFGAPVKGFIDRYFALLTIIFSILLIGGFALIKFVL